MEKVQKNILFSKEDFEIVKDKAKVEYMSVSAYMRRAVLSYVGKND